MSKAERNKVLLFHPVHTLTVEVRVSEGLFFFLFDYSRGVSLELLRPKANHSRKQRFRFLELSAKRHENVIQKESKSADTDVSRHIAV